MINKYFPLNIIRIQHNGLSACLPAVTEKENRIQVGQVEREIERKSYAHRNEMSWQNVLQRTDAASPASFIYEIHIGLILLCF